MHPDTLLELSKKSIEGSGSNVVFGLIDHNLVTSFQFSPTFNVNFELLSNSNRCTPCHSGAPAKSGYWDTKWFPSYYVKKRSAFVCANAWLGWNFFFLFNTKHLNPNSTFPWTPTITKSPTPNPTTTQAPLLNLVTGRPNGFPVTMLKDILLLSLQQLPLN